MTGSSDLCHVTRQNGEMPCLHRHHPVLRLRDMIDGRPADIKSTGVSIEYENGHPHCVRGFNHPCGWFCVPLQSCPEHSFLTGYIQTDLRGMLPQSTVDFAMAGSLVNFYSDLRKALKKS
ncbi:hypothetical protein AB205_0211010 [Aquarana catesbeiana]|uniref:START domain-containing protein n=1 Tax=Aquarana catesbeiana TaxID=8400 RepID=A0A2G9RXM9_AQUCT|nr:hypothetical protein AB205_0211010 [Aquarana catesbeiana]